MDVVSTLIRTGTISSSDFIGSQTYVLADGSKVPSERFLIRSLKIGEITLADVTAGVGPATGSLLLGQSFLSRFESWSMDNTNHSLVLNQKNSAGNSAKDSRTALDSVQSFYSALSAGDGQTAETYVAPEKRTGNFSGDAISNYYGSMIEPLQVKSIDSIDATSFLVEYYFRSKSKTCDGRAIVSTVSKDGNSYIEFIRALNGC